MTADTVFEILEGFRTGSVLEWGYGIKISK
jgi:hypothetical protein